MAIFKRRFQQLILDFWRKRYRLNGRLEFFISCSCMNRKNWKNWWFDLLTRLENGTRSTAINPQPNFKRFFQYLIGSSYFKVNELINSIFLYPTLVKKKFKRNVWNAPQLAYYGVSKMKFIEPPWIRYEFLNAVFFHGLTISNKLELTRKFYRVFFFLLFVCVCRSSNILFTWKKKKIWKQKQMKETK